MYVCTVLKPSDARLSCFHMMVVQYHILLIKGAVFEGQRLLTYKADFSLKIKENPWCFQTGEFEPHRTAVDQRKKYIELWCMRYGFGLIWINLDSS